MLKKNQIIAKTLEVGSSTLLSRILGIFRERLLSEYLGLGVIAEAFFMAYKIPNSLRKIFAEGALSVSFIPTFVQLIQIKDKDTINRLITLSFIVIEGLVLCICIFAFFNAELVLRLAAPGWFDTEPVSAQANYAISYLRILLPFILFLSSSSLLAGVLQSVGHFFVPAFSPVLLNIVFILSTIACIYLKLPVEYLAFFVVFGSALQFVVHLFTYIRLGFGFNLINLAAIRNFMQVMKKFMPSFISMSVKEIHFFIDTSLASFLPTGSVAHIYYADRFGSIPHGVFAIAFSTILLPYFSSVRITAPERLSFYLFESAKLIFFVMVPITIVMMLFSQTMLATVFLSQKFTVEHIEQTAEILNAFLTGLVFFSLNKILFNIFYALHDTILPLYMAIFSLVLNFGLSYYVFMPYYGATGIALATSCAAAAQSLLALLLLKRSYAFDLYLWRFTIFLMRFLVQLSIIGGWFFCMYTGMVYAFELWDSALQPFFTHRFVIWLWLGPLLVMTGFFILYTRRYFGIKLYFLDQ